MTKISMDPLHDRLFGQHPQPPAENRPGVNRRDDFRSVYEAGNTVPEAPANPLLSDADMARAALLMRRLSALIQNTNLTASLPAHSLPHLWSTPIDQSARFSLPAAVGNYQTVITYRVQPGRWARISGYGVDVDGAFTYDGSILWQIAKNGIPVQDLFDWGEHRGSVIRPRETFITGNGDNGTNQGSGDVFTFSVRRAIAAGAPSIINMALVGWTWRPRNNYEGTQNSVTAF